MSQSLFKVYAHIVFSTKHRIPFIDEQIQTQLYQTLGILCTENDCNPIQIGGAEDHIHILCTLSKKVQTTTMLRNVKSKSSLWMKQQDGRYGDFRWQDGYAAFSVGQLAVPQVVKYIENQKRHHQEQNYKDELLNMLKQAGIEWDDRYLWD